MALKLTHDSADSLHSTLHHGDCLLVLNSFPPETFQLIYADPPFFSDRAYLSGTNVAFVDRWKGGIREYLAWIEPRLAACHKVLRTNGSMYLHCDYHASHYLKVLMDRIFGYENFVNEIIWKRQSAHSDNRQGAKHFGRIHDTIFFYSKSREFVWNDQYLPYDNEYVRRHYCHVEPETQRRYALGDLTGPGGASKGNPYFEFLGVSRYWRYSKHKMEELLKDNRIYVAKPGNVPLLKRYLDEMKGVPIQDIWLDNWNRDPGSISYPTEKTQGLLSRIIRASSDSESFILDPFCGSGSTLLAAHRLGRSWCGIDTSKLAIEISRRRLLGIGAEVRAQRIRQCFAIQQADSADHSIAPRPEGFFG
jgi:DNA modification methylase